VQHQRLFFAELRVGGPSYAACRALAGTLRGESAAENQLVERYMRPYGSGPLHARRMERGLADPVPPWRRGVLSSSELAALRQLPGPALRLPGLVRSPLPRAPAPTSMSRTPEHALLRDERGPVGIRPEDRSAGLGLIGGQGTGKTAAMCRSVASDARDPDCALIVPARRRRRRSTLRPEASRSPVDAPSVVPREELHRAAVNHDRAVLTVSLQAPLDCLDVAAARVAAVRAHGVDRDLQLHERRKAIQTSPRATRHHGLTSRRASTTRRSTARRRRSRRLADRCSWTFRRSRTSRSRRAATATRPTSQRRIGTSCTASGRTG
jgi:hypothetical protein